MREYLFVVDEHNIPLRPRPRKDVIAQGLWRRTSGCIILSQYERVLCQKRSSTKDERPGIWIAMFGGKSLPNESAEATLIRELNEELGIAIESTALSYFDLVKSQERKQFEYLYIVRWNGHADKIAFDPKEVSRIAWLDIDDAIDALKRKVDWYSYGYDIEMLKQGRLSNR